MKKRNKRILALLTTLTMAMSSMTVLAEEDTSIASGTGNQTGDSYIEGIAPTDVYSVVLPTTTASTYDFVLDPDNLLAQYDANKAKYTPNSLYFTNTGGTYTGTSDVAMAVNKSTTDVLLTVDVEVTNVATNPVTFTSLANVEADTNANVALALVPATADTNDGTSAATPTAPVTAQQKDLDANGKASLTFLLTGTTSNFDITQGAATTNGGHTYTYTEKSTGVAWTTAGFALTGKCNTTADWTDFNTASNDSTNAENLSVKVTYTMTKLTADQKAQLEAETDPVVADTTTALVEFEEVAVVDPTPAHAEFGANNTKVWLNLTSAATGAITDSSKLTSVTVAQNGGSASAVTYTLETDWVLITWDNVEAAGCTWNSGDTYTFTFVYDGTTYEASLTAPAN